MKSQTHLGTSQGAALIYFTIFPLLFLSTPSEMTEASGSISWLTPLLGALSGGVLLWIQQSLLTDSESNLLQLTEELLGKGASYAFGLFYFFALFSTACLWTRQYAENTLLVALPAIEFNHIIVVYLISVLVMVYLGLEALSRTCYLLVPLSLVGLAIVFAGLTPEMEPLYLLPLLGYGIPSLIDPLLFYTGATAPAAMMMVLAPSFQNKSAVGQVILYGIGVSAITSSVAFAVYVAVFAVTVGSEKILPFFDMTRLVYINRYIQRIESLFILMWVIVGIVGIAVCLYGALTIICQLFRLPAFTPLLLPLGIIMITVATLPMDANQTLLINKMLFSKILAPGFVITTLALLLAAKLKKRREQNRCGTP